MYSIRPPAVYIHESVLAKPECVARMERMLSAIEGPDPVTVDDAQLNELSAAGEWDVPRRLGELHRTGDPTIIFNTFRWWTPEQEAEVKRRYPHLAGRYLIGNNPWTYRDGRATLKTHYGVCQNAYELHSAWGCLHRCDYCDIGTFFNIMLNLEELVERVDALVQANPWLQLYKYDNHTDTITLEPEYGASELMVGYFARQPDRYLMLYTKSANVDHLLELDHRGHTIICWSQSCETTSRLIEKGAATCSERIAAAEACQRAGYIVRGRFSPIVPVKNWREENAAMIEEYLTRVRPDVITMDTFKWLAPEKVGEILDLSLWDDEYQGYVEKFAAMDPTERPRPIIPQGKQLFPDEARAAIYRFFLQEIRKFAPEVPVSLCGETPDMWQELAAELHMSPDRYVCSCGPTSVPGNPLLDR